jgi:hypothetical protein
MPKPKYIRIDTRPKAKPKAKPKREPYIRCQKTGKQRTAEEMMIERQIKMYQIQKKRRTQEERRSILNG